MTSPTAGVVGDIPVRVGDRVTPSTVLTTVDENAGLEIYVNVPVAQATGLKRGLPLRVLDEQGKVIGTYKVGFVSPSVDDATQTVLVKADVEQSGRFRTDQFVRAQIVWSTQPGLTVPVVAVNRINGQYFAFVAEPGANGATVARQRGVTLGAGRRQRLRRRERPEGGRPADRVGHPEDRRRRAGAGHRERAGAAAGARRLGRLRGHEMLSDVFIRRPILATVCSLLIILAGAIAIPTLPIARYPDLTPPAVTVTAFYTGANAQAVESAVTTPLEQVINGVEGMTLHHLVEHQQRARRRSR